MKNWFWMVVFPCLLVVVLLATDGVPADQVGKTKWAQIPVPVTAEVAADEPTPALVATKFRKGPTRKQRREMGATFGNVLRILRDKQNRGVDLSDYTVAELAVDVGKQLLDENPKAFADPEVDWDSLLPFLEWLIELIMTFIGMFSQSMGIPCGFV